MKMITKWLRKLWVLSLFLFFSSYLENSLISNLFYTLMRVGADCFIIMRKKTTRNELRRRWLLLCLFCRVHWKFIPLFSKLYITQRERWQNMFWISLADRPLWYHKSPSYDQLGWPICLKPSRYRISLYHSWLFMLAPIFSLPLHFKKSFCQKVY